MSLFDAIGGFFADNADKIIPAVAQAGGAFLAADANRDAAEEARAAAESQAAAVREGNRLAQARYEQRRQASEPAMAYLRQVMAQDPSTLSPQQQRQFDDFMRGSNARLAASGLRGAGRAGVAAVNEGAAQYRANAFGQNQQRSDSAARTLASDFQSVDNNLAGLDRDTARATGDAAMRGGMYGANAGVANAGQLGSAIGAISTLFAREGKERDSQYKQQRTPIPAPMMVSDENRRAYSDGAFYA